jgi:hypothetical protein
LFIADTSELPSSRVRGGGMVGEMKEHSLLLLMQSTWIRNGTSCCQKVTVLKDFWSEINVIWIFWDFVMEVCISCRLFGLVSSVISWQNRYCMYKACSKKDRTFAIKTLFYNILSTVSFKVVPSSGDTPFPTFLPFLECTFCDGVQFSYRIFLNLRVFKKSPNFLNSSPTSKEDAIRLWVHLAAGFDNKLPFVPFRYEH